MTTDNSPEQTPAPEAITPAPAKKSRKGWLIGAAAAIVVAAGLGGVAAYAKGEGHGMMGGRMGGMMMERMLDNIDATAEQRTKISAITDKLRTDMEGLRGERRAVMEDLVTILKSGTIDRAPSKRSAPSALPRWIRLRSR